MTHTYPSRIAEKIVFRERFTNSAMVHRNGGVLTGSPSIKNGVDLDRSATEYVTYSIPGSTFASAEINIVVEFTPTFNNDAAGNYYFFDTTAGLLYQAYKATAGGIVLYLGNTVIATIPEGSVTGVWLQSKRNILVVSGTTGDTNVWLNGTQILVNDATAWSPLFPTALWIGASDAGSNRFDGVIHSLSIGKGLLTQLDVSAIQDRSLFTYRNRCTTWFDMEQSTARVDRVPGAEERFVDGDMEAAGIGAWTVHNNAALTKEVEGGNQFLRIAYNGTSTPGAYQTIMEVGKRYRLSGRARTDGSPGLPARVSEGLSGTILFSGTFSITTWEWFDVLFTATEAIIRLWAPTSSAGAVEFDDVSIVETTEQLVDSDMEVTGVGEWTAGRAATLTKETTDPYEGTQVLRIARSTTVDPYAYQIVFTVDKKYRITGWARSDGSAVPNIGAGGTVLWAGTTDMGWQWFDVIWSGASPTFVLLANTNTGTEWVEFDSITVREVLDQTLDKGPLGKVLQLGDGQGTAAPVLVPGRGFDFDGSDYMLMPRAEGVFNNTEQTIVVGFRPDDTAEAGTIRYLFATAGGEYVASVAGTVGELQIKMGSLPRIDIPLSNLTPYWNVGGENVLVMSGTPGDTDVWFNGVKLVEGDTSAWTPADPNTLHMGSSQTPSLYYDGKISHFSTYAFRLSNIQARDLFLVLGVSA